MYSYVRLIIVIVLAGFLLAPWRATRVLAVLDLLLLVPGWALAMRARAGFLPGIGLAAAVSPTLFGGVVFVAMLAGAPAAAAGWIAAAIWAAVFLVFGGGSVEANDAERRIARTLFVIVLAGCALAFFLPLTHMWWRVREDSWFHAAVLEEVLRHGVPPTDPYFTPLRLQYMYFYHVLLAGVSSLTGVGPFQCMILVNAAAMGGCVFGFGYLAGFFSRRVGPRVLGAVLAVFGMNGLFYLFYSLRIARASFGETSGPAVLHHFFRWSPLGHDTAVGLLSVENNQFLFLDKFMVGTALSLTLGLVCVALGLILSARRGRWSRAHAALFVIAVAGTLYLHGVIGVTVVFATLVSLAFLMVIHSDTDRGGPSYATLATLTLVAAAVAAPFLYSVMPHGDEAHTTRIAFQWRQTLGLLSDILPALILAIPFLRWTGKSDEWRSLNHDGATPGRASDETPPPPGGVVTGRLFGEMSLSPSGILLLWTLAVLVAALFVDLPTTNETKFSFLLFLPLAALATGGIERLWRSRGGRVAAVAVVLASTLPLNAVYFYQAAHDTHTFQLENDEAAAYEWIARATQGDAVFIDSDDVVRIPVLGRRDLYWGNETYAFNWGYPVEEMRLRRQIRDEVYSKEGLSEAGRARLRALRRPVWVMCRQIQFDRRPLFEKLRDDPLYSGRFIAGDYAVFALDFAAADSAATADSP